MCRGESLEVATRFGLASPGQDATRARHQWKHVPGLVQILGTRAGRNRGAHRVRAIMGRDARRDTLRGLDADRETGAVTGPCRR